MRDRPSNRKRITNVTQRCYLGVELLEERLPLTLPPEVIDINRDPYAQGPFPVLEYNGNLIFYDGGLLKRTDGGGADGVVLATTGSLEGDSYFTVVGNRLLYKGELITTEPYTNYYGTELFGFDVVTSSSGLIKDIYTGSHDGEQKNSSVPFHFVNDGLLTYFWAVSSYGFDIWKSDGTASGTAVAYDTTLSTVPATTTTPIVRRHFPKEMVVANGVPVWVVEALDGTGPVMGVGSLEVTGLPDAHAISGLTVADDGSVYFFLETTAGSWQHYRLIGSTLQLLSDSIGGLHHDALAIASTIFFSADNHLYSGDAVSGFSLVYTGTAGNSIDHLTALNGNLYFLESQDALGTHWTLRDELGNNLVANVVRGNIRNTQPLVGFNSSLYFAVDDTATGIELWRSDGTALGTGIVADLVAGVGGSRVDGIFAGETKVYFQADASGSLDSSAFFETDGTLAGTIELSRALRPLNYGSTNSSTFKSDDLVAFLAIGTIGRGIYVTDGTFAGTTRLSIGDLIPTAVLEVLGSRIVFQTEDQVWVTDGTDLTLILEQARVTSTARAGSQLFLTIDPQNEPGTATKLWATDGTFAGTAMVDAANFSLSPNKFAAAGNKLYYVKGNSLVLSDGTLAGTSSVAVNNVDNLLTIGGTAYFTVQEPNIGWTFWRSDGTIAGTYRIADVEYGNTTVGNSPTIFNGDFYVATESGKLFKTNGTLSGSLQVSPPELTGLRVDRSFVMGDYLYFFSSEHLYRTDGTMAGTSHIVSLPWRYPPLELVVLGGRAYITFVGNTPGYELWITDGTAAGTGQIFDLVPEGNLKLPRGLTEFNGRLLFTANNQYLGFEPIVWNPDSLPIASIAEGVGIIYADQGRSISLSASRSVDPIGVGPLTFDWDLDDDGVYDDFSGESLNLSWTQLQDMGIDTRTPLRVGLRVNTPDFRSSATHVSLLVLNFSPVAAFIDPTPNEVTALGNVVIRLSASDSWPADEAEGFIYHIDWNGDGVIDQSVDGPASGISVAHQFTAVGIVTIHARVQDRGGDMSVDVARTLMVYPASMAPINSELFINTFTTNGQQSSAVATDGLGNYVVVWVSANQDGSGNGIYMKTIGFDGSIPSTDVRVNTYTSLSQTTPAVAMNSAGEFVVVWSGAGPTDSDGIYAQRYNPGGIATGSQFRVNTYTTSKQQNATVAMDNSGNFIIVWESSGQDGSGYGIYAQRYNSAGGTLGMEFRVNSYTTNAQSSPDVAMDADGDIIVTWQGIGPNASSSQIFAQRYNSQGLALGTHFRVNTTTTTVQSTPTVAVDAIGNAVIAWNSINPGSEILGQRFDNVGTPIGSEFLVNSTTTYSQNSPEATMDSTGQFVIAWQDSGNDGNDDGIYARAFGSNGHPVGISFLVNTLTDGSQSNPAIVIDSAGRLLITWTSAQESGSIHGQIYSTYFQLGFSYQITEGQSLSLNGLDPADPGDGSYNYSWDLDGDNEFDDAIGSRFTLSWNQLRTIGIDDVQGSHPIRVQVVHPVGTTVLATTLVIKNAAPSIVVSPTSVSINPGESATFTFTANDVAADAAAGFTYHIDWNSDNVIDESIVGSTSVTVSHTYSQGSFTGKVTVLDKDGGSNFFTFSVVANAPPTANAGGPYTIHEGDSLTLDGSLSTDPGDTLTYSWDLFGNLFGFVNGVNPTLTWTQLLAFGINDGPTSRNIRLRVIDSLGVSRISAPTLLTILPAAPTVQVNGWSSMVRGQARDFSFMATDSSPVDQAANMIYSIDWDGNGVVDQTLTGPSAGVGASHVFAASGTYNVKVTATDRDGMTSTVATHTVNVVDWALLQDPVDSSKTDLHWGGTIGSDAYGFAPGGFVFVQVQNNQFYFTPQVVVTGGYNGKLYVYAQGSNDLLFADILNQPVVFDGGDGDDVLVGGRGGDYLDGGNGNDILLGGTLSTDGNDTIYGGAGNDLLVGHYGADRLSGNAGEDVLIAGTIYFNDLPNAVYAIQAELLSGRPYADRVANLSGTGVGPRNNGDLFLKPTISALDDGAIDEVLGGADQDWLLADLQIDLHADLAAEETLTDLL